MKLELNAAVWSATAASFAALSSFLTMRIHARNLQESVRPEIVVTGWDREEVVRGSNTLDIVRFTQLKNVGKGAAYTVILNTDRASDDPPTAVLTTTMIPVLAPNETFEVSGEVLIWWKNVAPDNQGAKFLPFGIKSLCWDRQGRRHATTQSVLAVKQEQGVLVGDQAAPGVMLGPRSTRTDTVWWLKLRARLARIPLLGRRFRD